VAYPSEMKGTNLFFVEDVAYQKAAMQEMESHHDLNDACVYLLQGLANQGLELPKIQWIEA